MTLEEFGPAEGQEGYRYELSRGVVTVTNIANRRHSDMVNAVRKQFSAFEVGHPGVIQFMAGGSDCKMIIAGLDSERHPDWAVYKTAMPRDVTDDDELWGTWVPDLVVEVVSPDPADRDYVQKPEEYLRFGVPEYWVVDEDRQELLAQCRRAARYVHRVVRPGEAYGPPVLRGIQFDVAEVFEAARAAGA